MSGQSQANSHGRKRKRCDAGFVGDKGKKEARKTDSDSVLSHAPQSVKIVDFVENRATEIVALMNHVETIGGTKLVSQRLPRHMRRRALSHDIRRLPKRLREVAAKEIERASSTKRPSRKYRRRPKNLMSEYERRQRRITWLETHIWHAKRFHMIDKWGYRLALHPNDKSMRACHRAADKYCLLQDVSFECCIEMTGSEEMIRRCLKHVVSDKTGPTVLGKQYVGGNKWGHTVMFACDQYPMGALGEVSFLWRPQTSDKEAAERQLWVWIHPASFELIWEELKQCITLETNGGLKGQVSSLTVAGKSSDKVVQAKNGNENSSKEVDQNAVTSEVKSNLRDLVFDTAEGIKLQSLKDALPKFRLTGQTSQAVVSEVLQPSDISTTDATGTHWWQRYYTDGKDKTIAEQKQVSDWLKSCQSAGDASPHQVIGLTARDPRLLLPPKKTKLMSKLEVPQIQAFPDSAVSVSDSPLWEKDVRQQVKASKMSDHELNKKRGENLVPGTSVNLGQEESRIPVLLLQRPGYRNTTSSKAKRRLPHKTIHPGFGCGWDVIVPPGWGTAFHVAFVFRGCRVGGLRESRAVLRESGGLEFPTDYPDTPAGRRHAEEQRHELQKKYERNPPAKRPNYVKMGVQDPFFCPWSQLVDEWMTSFGVESHSREFFVLRNFKMLKLLSEALVFEKKDSCMNRFEAFPDKADLEQLTLCHPCSLVPVRVTMHGKGVPSQFAHVCIPNVGDFMHLKDSDVACPVEPKHSDPVGALHRKEKKMKKKSKKSKTVDLVSALSNPSNPMEAALAGLLQRDLTETQSGVAGEARGSDGEGGKKSAHPMISSTNRQIIGFINDGDFSLSQGQGHGKAFCSLLGLVEMLRCIPADKPCLCLVRNTSSLQYRFAWLSIHL